jgi:hypothetical protein
LFIVDEILKGGKIEYFEFSDKESCSKKKYVYCEENNTLFQIKLIEKFGNAFIDENVNKSTPS